MANRYCRKCGAKIEEGVKYCPNCGTPVLPDDDNKLDSTRLFNENETSSNTGTTDIPTFGNDAEDTQNLNTRQYVNQDQSYTQQYTRQNPSYAQQSNPYNNPEYTNSYEYEEPKKHTAAIIITIVIAVGVGLLFFLFFARPDFITSRLPFGHNNTAEKAASTEETTSKKKEDKESKATPSPKASSKADTDEDSDTTTGVLKTTDNNAKTVTTTKTGTVFVSANVTGPRRIRVRTAPSQSATDTSARKYDGDKVTVYETKQAEGYTWYRIGDNQWIAGDGTNFGVNMN